MINAAYYGDPLDPFGDGGGLGEPISAAIGIVGALVAAAAGAGSAIAGMIKNLQQLESAEIQQARQRGASSAEILQIRAVYREKRRAVRAAERRRKQTERQSKRRPGKEKAMQDNPDALEVLRRVTAGARATGDIAERAGMAVQEIGTGRAIDPWTGRELVSAGGFAPAPSEATAAPVTWWSKPSIGGIPQGPLMLGGLLAGVGLVVLAVRR
uniref:Uncharacterized protein n=1 Tax=viral metagenome TaxID=1070528 RepID=A0A6M3L2U7_9ZZZZ